MISQCYYAIIIFGVKFYSKVFEVSCALSSIYQHMCLLGAEQLGGVVQILQCDNICKNMQMFKESITVAMTNEKSKETMKEYLKNHPEFMMDGMEKMQNEVWDGLRRIFIDNPQQYYATTQVNILKLLCELVDESFQIAFENACKKVGNDKMKLDDLMNEWYFRSEDHKFKHPNYGSIKFQESTEGARFTTTCLSIAQSSVVPFHNSFNLRNDTHYTETLKRVLALQKEALQIATKGMRDSIIDKWKTVCKYLYIICRYWQFNICILY